MLRAFRQRGATQPRARALLDAALRRSTGGPRDTSGRERTCALQRFRSAIDAGADAVFLIDAANLSIIDVSDGACRMLGVDRAGLLGADPVRLGLGVADELARHAHRPVDAGTRAEMADAQLRHADPGVVVAVEICWQVQLQPRGGARTLIAVARDVRERLQVQQRLVQLASYDSLTGLPNRPLFYQSLQAAIELARDAGSSIVVLFIALERFRFVNDAMGAALGDELLRQFSNRLVACAGERDTVGRLGGDEFALILATTRGGHDALAIANHVRAALRAPFELHGQNIVLTASIGVALYPDDALDPVTLIRNADTAMRGARQAGRDGCRFYTADMNLRVRARIALELALRGALGRGEFLLYFQPKMTVRTGGVSGMEALLRWQRPGHGLVPPSEFVAVMEETGLIVPVGAWVIDAACRQIAAWRADGVGEMRVAVNVSSRQFVEGDLEAEVRGALERHQVPGRLLELELTESSLMVNPEHAIEVLGRLKRLGIEIAIDDFGTGYSSLAYLKRLPIDKLKIDIAFVRDVATNADDAAIAEAIITMAHSLRMVVIAEGVESPAQLAYLESRGCDQIQGYHFSPALPAEQVLRMVLANRARAQETAPVMAPVLAPLVGPLVGPLVTPMLAPMVAPPVAPLVVTPLPAPAGAPAAPGPRARKIARKIG